MLVPPPDAASEAEAHALLAAGWFGHLVVSAEPFPVVVPAPYVWAPDAGERGAVLLHLHRTNPAFDALAHAGRAAFAVSEAEAYVPTTWNGDPDDAPEWSAPTAYFAAVQILGRAEVLTDPAEVAAVVNRQLVAYEPDGPYAEVAPGETPFGRMLPGIWAVRVEAETVRARIKAGGNRTADVRERIARELRERGSDADLAARDHVLRRLHSGR